MNSPDKHLEQRARALYREASSQLDPVTAGRLRAARRTALEAAQAPIRASRHLLPISACAAVILVVTMAVQPLQNGSMAVPEPTVAHLQNADTDSELPPDADSADPNLYQNLDFYGWLASNNRGHGNGGDTQ